MYTVQMLIVLMLFIVAAMVGRFIFRRWARGQVAKWNAKTIGEQCECGYLLKGLEQARCPECGRVIHFNATAEELGLTPEELERAQLKRQQRMQARKP